MKWKRSKKAAQEAKAKAAADKRARLQQQQQKQTTSEGDRNHQQTENVAESADEVSTKLKYRVIQQVGLIKI